MPKLLELVWVVLLCALAVFFAWDHTRGDAITHDEPIHIYAGVESVAHGVVLSNPEHPPLAKSLAALSLLRGGIEIPPPRPTTSLPPASFLLENRIPQKDIVALARAPFRWVFAALIVVVYLAARAAFGTAAAMLASALIALDPNFLAHAGIVHTDVTATTFMTLTIVLAITASTSPVRWLLTGVVLGLAIATKFTALILVPLVFLAPLLQRFDEATRAKWKEAYAGAAVACVVAAFVVYGVYAVNMRSMHPDDAAFASARFLHGRRADRETIVRYAQLTQRAPEIGMFLSGVKGVQITSSTSRGWNYLNGRVSREGFPHYFFAAFLVKSTPALLLVTLAIVAGLKRDRWTVGLLVPVVAIFAVSVPSSFNIGVRHILPVYPLLAIAGAGALVSRLTKRTFAVAATALVVSAGVSLATIHPFELGYFNFIGGPERLSDSNVDWMQDIDRLHVLLRERGWEKDTTVLVFAHPRLHGIERYRPPQLDAVRPGRYAMSHVIEHIGPQLIGAGRGPEAQAGLQRLIDTLHARGRKVARVGASITIWELPPAGVNGG